MTRMPGLRCLILTACVAFLAAGCAAASSKTAPGTTTAATAAPTTQPASGSAIVAGPGSTPEQIARIQAAALLADFVPPPGARRLAVAPASADDVLGQPTSSMVSTAEVDQVTFWMAPGQPPAVLAWERAHLPRAITSADNGSIPQGGSGSIPQGGSSGASAWVQTFQLAPAASVITEEALVVKVASTGSGQTGIRVDAEVAWQPPRLPSTFVPGTAQVVTLAEVPLMTPHPKLPSPVTITSEPVVRQLVALVNGLPLSTVGAAPCAPPFGNALQLTFRARPGGPPLAVAEGPESCGTVALTLSGKEQPALRLTDSFIGSVLQAAGLHWQVR